MLNECASLNGGILDILDHYRLGFKKMFTFNVWGKLLVF